MAAYNMKNKYATYFLLSLLTFVFLTGGSAAESSVSVSPQAITSSVGDTFTIEIIVDSADSEIYGAQFELYFDDFILNATSIEQGTFITKDGADSKIWVDEINNTLGKIVYGEARMGTNDGIIGSDVLASINFKTKNPGTSSLILSYVMLVDVDEINIIPEIKSGTCIVPGSEDAHSTAPKKKVVDISVEAAYEMIESNPEIIILDVSSRDEYDSEHITDAEWIQISDTNAINELDKYKDHIIIVYSRDGIGSREACSALLKQGFNKVNNMVGGINAWRINFPVFSAPKPSPTKIPASSPLPTVDPTSTELESGASSGGNNLPGFEILFSIAGLLGIFIIKRKNVIK